MTNLLRRVARAARKKVISLPAQGPQRGAALLSYQTIPFRYGLDHPVLRRHSNLWECREMARLLQAHGLQVDVIDFSNHAFVPRKSYQIAIDIHSNLERWEGHLPADCLKVLHITGAHWLWQNEAELRRLRELQGRRGLVLPTRRQVEPSFGLEHATCATMLGEGWARSTFNYSPKPIHTIIMSSPTAIEWAERDYARAGRSFMWLGSAGFVYKGLDRTLEAFAQRPDLQLTVCGPLEEEPDFVRAYHRELYELPNIRAVGWVDMGSAEFAALAQSCGVLIYPSSCEGCCGAVVTAMHAGLIPLISLESGVAVHDEHGEFGTLLPTSSLPEILAALDDTAALSPQELRDRAHRAWQCARQTYTRANFTRTYEAFLEQVLDKK